MRLGILGGTFNPVHYGHLRIAEDARDSLNLEKVIFVPASVPPHKGVWGDVPFSARYEMTSLAVENNRFFTVDDIETRLPAPSYTVNLLDALKAEYPDSELFFIIGSDSWLEITTWHRYEEIFEKSSLAVALRPGFSHGSPLEHLPERLQKEFILKESGSCRHSSGNSLFFFRGEQLDISSSRMREIAASGGSLRYLAPESVIEYIKMKRIYQNG